MTKVYTPGGNYSQAVRPLQCVYVTDSTAGWDPCFWIWGAVLKFKSVFNTRLVSAPPVCSAERMNTHAHKQGDVRGVIVKDLLSVREYDVAE